MKNSNRTNKKKNFRIYNIISMYRFGIFGTETGDRQYLNIFASDTEELNPVTYADKSNSPRKNCVSIIYTTLKLSNKMLNHRSDFRL